MILLTLIGCADSAPIRSMEKQEPADGSPMTDVGASGGGADASVGAPSGMVAPRARMEGGGMGDRESDKDRAPGSPPPPPEPSAEAGAPARAWFPESFLWTPLVEIPASGTVTVPVVVPDTLTTWRVLALGHTRSGAQAGAVHTFRSSLPAYVDLVTPTFLYHGDVVSLPVLSVSQVGDPLSATLTVSANGATIGGGNLTLEPYGSRAETVTVRATRAGPLALAAHLSALDAVERSVPVRPVGRPVEQARGGSLAGPRTLELSASPGATDGILEVQVYAGALGVVGQELSAAPARGGGIDNAAYIYAVTGLAGPLVTEGAITSSAHRAVQLTAWQLLARATRTPGIEATTSALVGVRMAPADSLAGRLGVRLAEQLRAAQAPDGMWTLGNGAALDGTLVQSARAVWALGKENQANRLRATGAFERYEARLVSPYLAAWGLAADVVDEASRDKHRATVRDALRTAPDGSKVLDVSAARPDGTPVGRAEATALAILALPADDPALPDLAGGLLGLYSPGRGFGDGWTGLLALQALQAVFTGEIPREVTVGLSVDDVEVARGVLDTSHPHAPVRLLAPGLVGLGAHRVTLRSDPPVPGLAFTLLARDYAPWTQEAAAGLDLSVVRPALVVGRTAAVTVAVSAPSSVPLDISLGLPAGVDPDTTALDALVRGGQIGSWHAEDGRITLRRVVTAGGAWTGSIPVTATLAGTLLADAAEVWPSGAPEQRFARIPERWTIAPPS